MPIDVVARGDGWVAVDKPAGVLVIPGRGGEAAPCLREQVAAALGTRVWVCHRIDRDTSGVVLFALTPEAHRTASMAFEHGDVAKRYLALVEGDIEAPRAVDVPLIEARKGRMRPAGPGEQGKPALTRVTPLERFGAATLVACEPRTGRQHQLRVHLKAVGHPLVFDHQYGRKTPWRLGGAELSRTPLHAARLEVPALGVAVEAPLPADLAAALAALRSAGGRVG